MAFQSRSKLVEEALDGADGLSDKVLGIKSLLV